jgi:hypothetical protein
MKVAASSTETPPARWRAFVAALVVLVSAPACVLDLAQKHGCRTDSDCAARRVCVDSVCAETRAGGVAGAAGTMGAAGATGGAAGAANGAAGAAGSPVADAGAERLDAVDAAETSGTADAAVDADAGSDSGDAGSLAEQPPRYLSSGTPNYMFVTSETFVPRFASLEVADQKCNDAASAAGLPGHYRAWLSTNDVSARDRIASARGWIRPDGTPFADRMADLVRGWIISPPSIDEHGHELPWGTDQPVATGTGEDGLMYGDACADWTAGDEHTTMAGSPWGTARFWTTDYGDQRPCSLPMHLYCFGIDHVAPVAPLPVAGKKAFLTDGEFVNRVGVEGADSLCALEAFMAGLTGTFRALLGTTTASAASRFPGGVPRQWVRMDGVPLTAPDQNLLAGARLLVPLNVTSRGSYLNTYVLTGITSIAEPAASTDETCLDWTAALSTDHVSGINGLSSFTPRWLRAYDLPGSCDRGLSHVYCLEQ